MTIFKFLFLEIKMSDSLHKIPDWLLKTKSKYISSLIENSGLNYDEAKEEFYFIPDEYYMEDDTINNPKDYKKMTEVVGFMQLEDLPLSYIEYTKLNTLNALKYLLSLNNAYVYDLLDLILNKININSTEIFKLVIDLSQKWNINYKNNFYNSAYNNITSSRKKTN